MLQVRGHVRHVQGAEPVPGARDAQHLPRLPHLRVHGQPPAVRRRDCVTVTQQRTSCFPAFIAGETNTNSTNVYIGGKIIM